MKKGLSFLLLISAFFLIRCNNSGTSEPSGPEPSATPVLGYSVLSTLPHDTSYFTEGLEFYGNTLLESTGLNGKSRLLQYEPASGKVLRQATLDPQYFGEGITVFHDTLYQMTYQEHKTFAYSVKDFKKLAEFPLEGEGWGMTHDDRNLIVSKGTSSLFFYEPGSFRMIRELPVTDNGSLVPNINELEYVKGFVYANQWQYNYILKIDPSSGRVVAKLDLTDLVTKVRSDGRSEFLNGIAYDSSSNKFYITGKNWPRLFEIQFDR